MTRKRAALASMAAAGALLLLAWSQTWFEVALVDGPTIAIPGSAAAGGIVATALATLAGAAALTIAPSKLRFALGMLMLLLGAVAVAVTLGALRDPIAASAPAVTAASGVSGRDSIDAIVSDVAVLAWPWTALVGSIGVALAGLAVLAGGRRWPAPGSRYDRAAAAPDPWDALTGGDDPTR